MAFIPLNFCRTFPRGFAHEMRRMVGEKILQRDRKMCGLNLLPKAVLGGLNIVGVFSSTIKGSGVFRRGLMRIKTEKQQESAQQIHN